MSSERIQQLKSIILDFDRITQYIPKQVIHYEPDPGKPAIIRRAEACVRVFDEASVNHIPGERFAGNYSLKCAARPDHLTAAEWEEIKNYPQGVSDELLAAMYARVFYLWSFCEGHIVPDKEKVLKHGFVGVVAEIEARLNDPDLSGDQRDFLQAA